MGMVVPYYSQGNASSTEEPVPTITTVDRHALVVLPFLLGYYTRPHGQQAAVSGVNEPMPTQSTQPRHYLVQPNKAPVVEDCGFRMLQPHEIKAAMAFPADYRVLGNKREQVRQLGNAVTPPAMNTLIQRVVQSLAPTVHSANRTDSPRTVEEMKR
jgi:DNA (cytosine-5)-methyltransferase 1